MHEVSNEVAQYRAVVGTDGSIMLAPLTNQDYVDSQTAAIASGASNAGSQGLQGDFNRIVYPTLNYLGVARIRVGTAMSAVSAYAQMVQDGLILGNPLNLLQYINNTPQLVRNLLNPNSSMATSISLQAMVARQAYNWGASHIANWSSYTTEQQAKFVTAFSALGEAYFNQQYGLATAPDSTGGGYTPDVTGDLSGANYLTAPLTGTSSLTGQFGSATNFSTLEDLLNGVPYGQSTTGQLQPIQSDFGDPNSPRDIVSSDGELWPAHPGSVGSAGAPDVQYASASPPGWTITPNADGTLSFSVADGSGSNLASVSLTPVDLVSVVGSVTASGEILQSANAFINKGSPHVLYKIAR
jgi:hypothetical protein